MSKKIRVLRIIHTLNPTLGGPSNAIIDNSIALVKKGFSIDILTSDRKKYYKNKKIKVFNVGPSIGNYGFSFKLIYWLFKNKKKYDLFIIHELWRVYNFIARLYLKNYFVFVHGQLDPYFETELFKKTKKKLYWFLLEKKNLQKSNSILLTTNEEKTLLNRTFVNTDGINKNVIQYGIYKSKLDKSSSKKSFFKLFPNLKNKKFLLYLGRFHKKKGCDTLIHSLKKIINQNFKPYILMVGPNNSYKKKLQRLCKDLNVEDYFYWSNTLVGKEKFGAIHASIGMVLASNGENFGISIVESLSCSKPVIITNKVNIYRSIIDYKAGYVSKNNSSDFSNILKQYLKLNNKSITRMSKNSLNCFNNNFNLSKIDNRLAHLLNKYNK